MATRDDDDEFDFSDPDLDALPSDTLRELERAAVLSTQRPQHTHGYRPIPPHNFKAGANYGATSVRTPYQEQQGTYGFNGEDVIDLNDESVITADHAGKPYAGASSHNRQSFQDTEQGRLRQNQRGGPPRPQHPISSNNQLGRAKDFQRNDYPRENGSYVNKAGPDTLAGSDADISVAELRARILEVDNASTTRT